jgi:AraC-like DNA-binding protein
MWENADVQGHTVPTGVVLELVSLVKRWNVLPREVLAGTGLREEELGDELARVPLESYLAAVRQARDLTNEPGLGFCMGLSARVSAFGHLGFAVMSAATVRDAIDVAVQFAPMISTSMTLHLKVESGIASLVVEDRAGVDDDIRDVIVISRLAALWNVAYALSGLDLDGVAEMNIPEPPYHRRFAHLVPGTRYGQPTNRIVMRAEKLDVPLLMADPAALRIARDRCEQALDSLTAGGRLVRRVRQLLTDPAGKGYRSLDEVASKIHMSPSTLKRRLLLQGHSMSRLLQEERRDRALLLLRSSALSVEEVAERLGYWSVQNFVRAFRRWTGLTPSAYRQTAGQLLERP